MQTMFRCYAGAAFGLEGLIAGELRKIGMCDVAAENGGVRFTAEPDDLFRCNLQMHFSDRLFIILGSGICKTFEDLYQLVFSLDWQDYFSGRESIDISCKCVRSTLMSQRDCQSVSNKAVIDKIRKTRSVSVFPEDGPSLPVQLTIRNDLVTILLNTSGESLSRRGYRTWNGEAPLRETLASALVELSPWKQGIPLHDPCCGTGTILIEAALMASGRAPGIRRSFAMEKLSCFHAIPFSSIRQQVSETTDFSKINDISGSDIDPSPLQLAEIHIRQAGLEKNHIPLRNIALQDLCLETVNGVFICNPPYGERLSDQNECRKLYHELFLLKQRHPTWKLCAISSDPSFERSFGRRADKKRRVYNGRLECVYYIYS